MSLREEKTKICQLIESWDSQNIELAFQIFKGKGMLLKAVQKYYQPIFKLFGQEAKPYELPIDILKNDFVSIHVNAKNKLEYDVKLAQTFNKLPIKEITLSSEFATIPWWLIEMHQLERLQLYGQFSQLPLDLDQLPNLKRLSIKQTGVSSFPAEIFNCKNLEAIAIEEENLLTELPNSITKLTSLKELWLRNTSVQQLPSEIGNLGQLEFLSLTLNKLRTIPKSIGQLSKLKELTLSQNRLTSIPDEITNLHDLKHLYLNNNKIQDLPKNIGNLIHLHSLVLDQNAIMRLPRSILALEFLEVFSIHKTPLGNKHKIKKIIYLDRKGIGFLTTFFPDL